MNWLDRAIAVVAPQAAVKRVRARVALEAVDHMLKRGYDGAKSNRRTQGWVASGSSANAEIESAGAKLRARSRDLVRNDPYAKRAIKALVANAIGTGITAESKQPAGKPWKQWVKECDWLGKQDFYGLQALAARCMYESGEVLIVRRRLSGAQAAETKSGVPLQLMVLEPDYLDTNKHGPQQNGRHCFSGVEVARDGRVQGYWLYDQHPGDAPLFTVSLTSTYYPAKDVIHAFEIERAGQLRGVPKLSAVILQMRDLGDYDEAVLVKKKVEACFAAFVTTDEENRNISAQVETESKTASNGNSHIQRNETLAPGMIEYLKPGESVEFGSPSAAPDGEFASRHERRIAVGVDLTYEILTGDLSRVNFSSARMGRQEMVKIIDQWRWLTFIPQVCNRVQDWFEESAYLAGVVRAQSYDFVWTPPKWDYVNPLDDVKTDREELAGALSSWSSQIRKRGEDPDAVYEEMKKDRERLLLIGVDVTANGKKAPDPAATNAGNAGADAEGDAADEDTAKNAEDAARHIGERFDRIDATFARQFAEVREMVIAKQPVTVNVTTPPVTIAEGAVRVQMDAPQVDVHLGETRVEPAAVNVTVAQPRTTVETIKRDANNEIVEIIREQKD